MSYHRVPLSIGLLLASLSCLAESARIITGPGGGYYRDDPALDYVQQQLAEDYLDDVNDIGDDGGGQQYLDPGIVELLSEIYDPDLGTQPVDQCNLEPELTVNPKLTIGDTALESPKPVQDPSWKAPEGLGQIAGVSVDQSGRPVVFHRADRIWDYDTFDENFEYLGPLDLPIFVNTVLTLNPNSGAIEDQWGKNVFYMPHGIHVDPSDNVWLTDVALHQVFKFGKQGNKVGAEDSPWEAQLVLGERFVPGNDRNHFCQPTAVAVTQTGEIVVADGYCNQRIVIFSPAGRHIVSFPSARNELLNLAVPHALAITRSGDICAADRDHHRIVCFNLTFTLEQHERGWKKEMRLWLPMVSAPPGACRIFGIAAYDNLIYAVNGPPAPQERIKGFTVNFNDGSIINTWGPKSQYFTNPHAIAVSPNGTALWVAEIGPNVLWKFRLEPTWSTLGGMK